MQWPVTVVRGILRGVGTAIRARPIVFVSTAIIVFALHVFLPPLVLSVVRKPVDFFTFNPWLSKLPEYLGSSQTIQKKLDFLPRLALFWFSSDSPYGGTEWGFAVDVTDLGRFLVISLLLGLYFALWFHRRDKTARLGRSGASARHGGVLGAFVSAFGLSTGPCSVVGCGAPVIPVVGLAVTGLSSGTLKLLAELSTVATAAVFVTVTLGIGYLGWLVGTAPRERPIPSRADR